jgi:AraC family transcriptional regulator
MEETLSGPVPRASAYPAPSAGIHPGDVHRLRRYESLVPIFSSFATHSQTSDSVRRVSTDALRDAVIELIHAVNSVLNEELESAVGSVQRSAALLQVNTRLPEFTSSTRIASPIARGGLAPWQTRLVRTHIDTHLDDNLRTKDLARLVQLSSFHFCRVFRVSFGHSPHAYVTRRRVERAQGLILTTGRTLGQIALDCGFADQAHFTKIFRRFCGESPGEWRRTRMGGTNEPILPTAD